MFANWRTKRRETKYMITEYQYSILRSLLGAIMDRDSNADESGEYFVRSLYFDSLNRRDFHEKEMGMNHRRKIRFRFYSKKPKILKFEVKEKVNKHTLKQSIAMDLNSAMDFFALDFSTLENEYMRLYDHMKTFIYRPSILIDYEREAYVSDMFNLRINFDKNIRGCSDPESWLLEDPFMIPLIDAGMMILEVKHDGHIPEYIQSILASVDLTSISYSKYYLGGL